MAVGIGYKEYAESADLAGRSVAEVRQQYEPLFGISDRAQAILNGRTLPRKLERDIRLNDCDELSFVEKKKSRMPLLAGALLLAMAIFGGVLAYTYITATSTMSVTAGGADFAEVTDNATGVSPWNVCGFYRGATGTGNLFDVDTTPCSYTGDFVVTVYLANAEQLSKVYRALVFKLEVYDSSNTKVDINGDGTPDAKDFALLTLANTEAHLFITQTAPDSYTIRVVSGFYFTHIWGTGWSAGYQSPLLFAEVAQR